MLMLGAADLPVLHGLANTASQTAQRRYLRTLRVDLITLVLGALAAAAHPGSLTATRALNVASASLFFAGFGLTLVLLLKQYDRIWYGGRAAAESVKTLAWRYAVRAEPFHEGAQREVDERFANSLRAVMQQREALNMVVERVPLEGQQITQGMTSLRAATLADRLAVYLRDRVDEQRRWYAAKSALNASMESRLFRVVLAAQACAGIFALVIVAVPEIDFNLPGVLTTIAAGFLVWMQAKQHQELAQAYLVASQELSFALATGASVDTEPAFSQFVSDTESAISREHTLWAARRDRLPPSGRI